MAKCLFEDGTLVSDYGRPYIIAEVNSSHNGSVDIAKQMIVAAKNAGCDCVKFQSWSSSSLYSKTYYKANPIAKRFVDKFSMSEDNLTEIIDYCNHVGIGFSSTPYSEREVDFLVEHNVPFIKIASMELNNPHFLEYIAKKDIPIVLSTGMGEYDEVREAVRIIEKAGNGKIVLLHCVSIYPADPKMINIRNIDGLRDVCPNHPVGFSDHTLGDSVAVAAISRGAAIIEKHMTLDKSKIGMDNQMAMEPDELKELVDKCRLIQIALGTKERVLLQEEYDQRKNMRRSIVTTRALKVGDIISPDDLYAKRPGTGVEPRKASLFVGKKVVRDIEEDELIFESDIV